MMNKICRKHDIPFPAAEGCPLCKPQKIAKKAKSVNGSAKFLRVKSKIVAPRDNDLCQRCWDKFKILREAKDCHHLLNQANPKWEDYLYDEENLVMLCAPCHDVTKRRNMIDALDFKFKTKLWRKIKWVDVNPLDFNEY